MLANLFDWDERNLEHIAEHQVGFEEAEEAFEQRHHLLKGRDGRYCLFGRSSAGRYLFIVFEYRKGHRVRVITARAMTETEKRLYHRRVE